MEKWKPGKDHPWKKYKYKKGSNNNFQSKSAEWYIRKVQNEIYKEPTNSEMEIDWERRECNYPDWASKD